MLRSVRDIGLALRCSVALGGIVGSMLLARPAFGYCRIVTETIPDQWDQLTSCFTGTPGAGALQVYWKNACVSFDLQQDYSRQVAAADATRIAERAFSAWSSVTCKGGGSPSIASHDLGPVACSAVQYNETQPNQHVVIFRDDAWPYPGDTFNTLGLTHLKFDKGTGEIFDADMEINSADHHLIVDGTPSDGDYLLESVLTHEAGHFLGLAHSTDPDAIMYAHYHATSAQLTQDDIDGICAIYPPDGTRSTTSGTVPQDSCDPTPRHGFASECNAPAASGGDDGGVDDTSEYTRPVHRSGCSVSIGPACTSEFVWALCLACTTVCALRRRRARLM
jgi:hypothetical protein